MRAAVTAENADDVVTAVRFRNIALWRALKDAEPGAGDAGSGDVRCTALALAVAAMAAQGEDGFSHGFVTDCAAEAAACSGVGHGWSPDGVTDWKPAVAGAQWSGLSAGSVARVRFQVFSTGRPLQGHIRQQGALIVPLAVHRLSSEFHRRTAAFSRVRA
jgi:hypothetical protein